MTSDFGEWLRSSLGHPAGRAIGAQLFEQLRGTAVNQLDGPHTALVTASRTGAILQRAIF